MKLRHIVAFAIWVVLTTPVAAQNLAAGRDAYEAGAYATALKNLQPLAEQGDALAQAALGVMYKTGRGVPQDYAEAVRWYQLAADQGHAEAQYSLGLIYEDGRGVPQDFAESMRWYRLAAEQGHAYAPSMLGFMYGAGRGVPQNFIMAHMWYNLAAAGGFSPAIMDRDAYAREMTTADISEAQRRAGVCLKSGYSDCE